MKRFLLLAIMSLALAGCASTGKASKFYDDPEGLLGSSRIEIRNVSVVIDYVNQKDIDFQVRQIAGMLFDREKIVDPRNILYADIEVNQRSFIDGIDPKNSLFVTLVVADANGQIISRIQEYAVGNESVLSSAVQYKYLADLVDPVNKERARMAKTSKK